MHTDRKTQNHEHTDIECSTGFKSNVTFGSILEPERPVRAHGLGGFGLLGPVAAEQSLEVVRLLLEIERQDLLDAVAHTGLVLQNVTRKQRIR